MAELFHDGRDAELLKRRDLRGNDTEDAAHAVLLAEVIATEAIVRVHLVSEVEIAALQILGPGALLADFVHHGLDDFLREDFIGDGLDAAVDSDLRGLALAEVKVGTTEFDELGEVGVDDGHGKRKG